MSPGKVTSMGRVALSLRASLEYLAAGFGFFGVTGLGSSFLGSSFFGVCFVAVLVAVLVGVLVGVAALESALVFCGEVSTNEPGYDEDELGRTWGVLVCSFAWALEPLGGILAAVLINDTDVMELDVVGFESR
jgi:hypothetical protein